MIVKLLSDFGSPPPSYCTAVRCLWAHSYCTNSSLERLPAPLDGTPHEHAFQLDEFQKRAISHIDRGESVLVSAHTSAGKTVCAERAIECALRDGQRVVYCSPIKALSNQKFQDLRLKFGSRVGLITGDVTLEEDSPCLVMTTEILRGVLYRGSTLMRELKWLIIDEVHLLGDGARGWVIEETLILLPQTVRFVLLSATVPNAIDIAEWVTTLHRTPCHVVHSPRRPTPLRHYAYGAGGDGLYLVLNEGGHFDESAWDSAVGALPHPEASIGRKSKTVAASADGGARQLRAAREVCRVVRHCAAHEMLPAIVFCFSRVECDLLARLLSQGELGACPAGAGVGTPQLLSDEEADAVEQVFASAVGALSEDDKQLAQVRTLLPLLRRGIGAHHSGMLPLLRELVEILFAEGLLRLLVATETVAMGLNLPARTAIFTGATKFDGIEQRLLDPTEYTQMSGRAGRRGIDAQGNVVLMLQRWLSAADGAQLLSSRYPPLRSQFALRYSSLLRLSRTEGAAPSTVIGRTLAHWQWQQERGARAAEVQRIQAELAVLEQAGEAEKPQHWQAAEYLRLRTTLQRLAANFDRRVRRAARPWLQPGRVVKVRGRGWGVLVSARVAGDANAAAASEAAGATRDDAACLLAESSTLLHILLTLDPTDSDERERGIASTGDTGRAAAPMHVLAVSLADVQHLSALRLWMPRDLQGPNARASVALALSGAVDEFAGELPRLDPIEHMGLQDGALLGLIERIENAEISLAQHPLNGSPRLESAYARCHRRQSLQRRLLTLAEAGSALDRRSTNSDASDGLAGRVTDSKLVEELKGMHRVLLELGYVTDEGVVLVKGRSACAIEGTHEVLAVEVLVRGALDGLTVAESAALLSCLLADRSSGRPSSSATPSGSMALAAEARGLTAPLDSAIRSVLRTAEELALLCDSCGVPLVAPRQPAVDAATAAAEAARSLVGPELAAATLAWAGGSTFFQAWQLAAREPPGGASVFEGTFVRALRSLDELILHLTEAARTLGDTALSARLEACSAAVHRGLPFLNSLYF